MTNENRIIFLKWMRHTAVLAHLLFFGTFLIFLHWVWDWPPVIAFLLFMSYRVFGVAAHKASEAIEHIEEMEKLKEALSEARSDKMVDAFLEGLRSMREQSKKEE